MTIVSHDRDNTTVGMEGDLIVDAVSAASQYGTSPEDSKTTAMIVHAIGPHSIIHVVEVSINTSINKSQTFRHVTK